MARKKTITREQILTAAYEVIATEGFSRFTARNIASKMKCSTQPIYLEFENMDDLRKSLVEAIYTRLREEVFPVEHTGDSVVDLPLNYIMFARKNPRLYKALYLENSGLGEEMHNFAYDTFIEAAKKNPKYSDLGDEKLCSIHNSTWIVATGVASLMTSGIIQPTKEEVTNLIQNTIAEALSSEEPVKISL